MTPTCPWLFLPALRIGNPTKFLFVAEPEVCDWLHPALKARFAGRCEIEVSGGVNVATSAHEWFHKALIDKLQEKGMEGTAKDAVESV